MYYVDIYELKKLIEGLSDIENIGIKSREAPIPDLKKIFCKLAVKYANPLNYPLKSIGMCLGNNYDHSSVIAAVKAFDNLYERDQLRFSYIYELLDKSLKQFRESGLDDNFFQDNNSIDSITSKQTALIEKLQNQISELKK